MKIALYCPVRERPETLALVLESHRQLAGVADWRYYDDNVDPESSAMLCMAGRIVEGIDRATDDYQGHNWTGDKMARMAAIRDRCIADFLRAEADAMLLVDADVVLPSGLAMSLAQCLSLERDIVSAVYWSKWTGLDCWMPNVWDVHNYKFDGPGSVLRLRNPYVFPVGGLGAVTLISWRAVEAGVRYRPIDNLGYFGEDRHFCTRAQALGFKLWADTRCTPFHVYRPEQLEEAQVWFESGCSRQYFDTWLNEEWERQVRAAIPESGTSKTSTAPRVLAVCTPGETFSAQWLWHYFELWTGSVRAKWGFAPFQGYCTNPYITRSNMTRDVLACRVRPKYVLWIDDDNLVEWQQVERLIADLDTHPEAAAVAGWAWIQADAGPDTTTRASVGNWVDGHFVSLTANELDDDELVEIDASGFPCLLMRTELLEALGPQAFLPDPADCTDHFIGEDVAFCLAAKRAGYRLYADGRVHVPHLKLRRIQPIEAVRPNVGNLVERTETA